MNSIVTFFPFLHTRGGALHFFFFLNIELSKNCAFSFKITEMRGGGCRVKNWMTI